MIQPVNLYIFNENSRASVYGIGTYIRELVNTLDKKSINVTVINLNQSGERIKTEETEGIKYLYFPAVMEKTPYLDYGSRSKQYYRNIVYLLRLHVTDTERVVFHLNYMYGQSFAEILRETFKEKVILTVHYFDWSFSLFGNVSRFRHIISQKQEENTFEKNINESYLRDKKLFDAVDRIICLSEKTRQIMEEDYKIERRKLSVVYNGLSDSRAKGEKTALREKYRLTDAPVVLFVGRIDEIKGLKYAIQAFKTVLKTLPDCRMLIAGNGSFDTCMKECEEIWTSVTFTGLIDKQHLYELYTVADLGVMPSFHEQCSYVAIEMIMHGVPLIVSDSTGLDEMVEEGVSGFHVPVTELPDKTEIDATLIAEKMLYLLQNPEKRKEMSGNARKRYEKLYTVDRMGENMLNIYNSFFLPVCDMLHHIDIHLSEHCNLNCAYCCHCSSVAEPEFLNIEQFERDITQLSKLTNGHVKTVMLLGGEPLQNPDIVRVMQITRQNIPYGNINILTNGILLAKMKEDFWTGCRNNKISVLISPYPIKLNTGKIFRTAQKYGVRVSRYTTKGRNGKDDMFRVQKFDMSGKRDIYRAYKNCSCRSPFLQDGKLYPCPPMPSSRHLEKRFGVKFEISRKDFLILNQVNDLQEILDFISRPSPFCRYCAFDNEFVQWKISENKKEEWIL
ncbi:MAG: TIGR04157 family glycosyltransferase [Tannerella sp.]|jgi:glycosyltransferase|nr:TIGR04157 family glycosyltransferase [Tannerella sp.]